METSVIFAMAYQKITRTKRKTFFFYVAYNFQYLNMNSVFFNLSFLYSFSDNHQMPQQEKGVRKLSSVYIRRVNKPAKH